MAKLSKAKARRRLLEAEAKFKKVYMSRLYPAASGLNPVKTADMEAVSKIVARCLKRIQ